MATKKATQTKAAKTKASAAPKVTAVRERMSKTALLEAIAQDTELSRKEVAAVLTSLGTQIERHIKPRAVGEFVLPGILKIKTTKKPAQKARKNVPNPFRPGETMDVAAKPARTVLKVQPLKGLKDMV